MTSTANRCAARNQRGEPCAAWAVVGSAFCYWHCPELAQERRRARSAGGRARHGRSGVLDASGGAVKLETVGDVVALLERAVRDVLALENSISRARAVGYLAGVAVRALELSDIENRIARLEQLQGVK